MISYIYICISLVLLIYSRHISCSECSILHWTQKKILPKALIQLSQQNNPTTFANHVCFSLIQGHVLVLHWLRSGLTSISKSVITRKLLPKAARWKKPYSAYLTYSLSELKTSTHVWYRRCIAGKIGLTLGIILGLLNGKTNRLDRRIIVYW